MKAQKIVWPILLLVTGFTCLFSGLTIPQQASQARIKFENDAAANIAPVSGNAAAGGSSCDPYHPYFAQQNRCDYIFIATSKPK